MFACVHHTIGLITIFTAFAAGIHENFMDNATANERFLTILLVEDNPAHAEMVMRSFNLKDVTIHIQHVMDGEAALDYLNQRGNYHDPDTNPTPDIILLDLRLPKIDGFEVLQAIKAIPELLSIPVIILTTSAAEKDINRGYQYHANSYLVKPIDFHRFDQLMNDLGYYWLVWNLKSRKTTRN
jgi:CheY-like chemotaxis protein